MSKQLRLSEKSVRITETRNGEWRKILSQYLAEVTQLNKEPARSHRFAMLMQQLLGMETSFIEQYCSGIETFLKVRGKDRILKGEADNLFGNVIIEFEANLAKHRCEAEEQLQRYVAILWSQESVQKRVPYICIAADGINFVTYSPIMPNIKEKEIVPEMISLKVLEESNWSRLEPHQIYYWLDRYFLRKEILHPTSEMMVRDFGLHSHAFQTYQNILLNLWNELKEQTAFSVIYENWEKYLRIVYGSNVAGASLFVRHTYLATLAKLMAWLRIAEQASLPNNNQILSMLEGHLFKDKGIENFTEEDFFSWIARGKAIGVGINLFHGLSSLLKNYNLRELSEDVLKALYQELVDPETRHDLGEYYTPDWLAHRLVRRLLKDKPEGLIFDPSCGSGTFLYMAIREKRRLLRDSTRTLNHIIQAVFGVDVHPLAVIIAKTNYVLALGDLIEKRKQPIILPVYLADTINLPERWIQTELANYRVVIENRVLHLTVEMLRQIPVYDRAVELAKIFAQQNKGKKINVEGFGNFLASQDFSESGNIQLVQSLFPIAEALQYFIENNRDSIWAFILKNIYKPLFLKRKFDFIVGNPPWIAFRFMEPSYQEILKKQIVHDYKLLEGQGHLITHLEIAALFLVRTADLYLKHGGKIAFVLPKSIFSADQHDILRRRAFRLSEDEDATLSWRELWDCEDVIPLFNVPSCVLIGEKNQRNNEKGPIPGIIFSGKLPSRNVSLEDSESLLKMEPVQFSLFKQGTRSYWATSESKSPQGESYYKKDFTQGATLVPRSFWFVKVQESTVGIDPNMPPLETDSRAIKEAKNNYKDICLRGCVEQRFLYSTLLSTDLLPFGHLDFRLVVLPILPESEHYKLFEDNEETHFLGYFYLLNWMRKAEAEWQKSRGTKSKNISSVKWLDYRKKLTSQNPNSKYIVLYNTSGTNLAACVLENKPYKYRVKKQHMNIKHFIVDTKNYYKETNDINEAFYLASILNSPVLNEWIKPLQSRGQWGPRDIHKKVFEFPIPEFNPKDKAHLRLAELGKVCSEKVADWIKRVESESKGGIGRLRSKVRDYLKEELAEIDKLVIRVVK